MSERGIALQLTSVWRRYKSGSEFLDVLRGAELEIHSGEIVGLVGPSGSGKSSLLHAAGLLEKPTEGQVTIDGEACVHGLLAQARCSACADACPQDALQMTAEGLVLDPAACTGCRLCAKKCPTQAITGEPKQPHVIDPAACIKCDTCRQVCKFEAVVVRSGSAPTNAAAKDA